MRLVALLSWFDEQPEMLADLIRGMPGVGIDHLVAVDGAYALYPGGTGGSAIEQHAAIRDTAYDLDLACTIHTPAAPWVGNELEKRTYLFKLGHAVADPYDDWLWVCDADEIIDSADVKTQLQDTSLDVAEVFLSDGVGSNQPIRKLFRAHPRGIRVVDAHYQYIDGDSRVLWGGIGRQVPALRLNGVNVKHRYYSRTKARLEARTGYYDNRTANNIERVVG